MTKKYLFGLRGKALENGLIWSLIFPAYTLFGWNNGIAGSLLDLPSWVATFPSIDTLNTDGAVKAQNARGTVVAMYTLGAFFGALSCIFLGDCLGRLRTMTLGAVVQTIGVIIQASSSTLAQLIVGRLITGLGFGALTATAPNWQSECATATHRGSAVIFESCFISLGLALQGWISFGLSFASGTVTWRFPLSMSIFWAFLVILALQFVPESPRWLLKKHRTNEARSVLSALDDLPPDSPTITASIREIEASLQISGRGRFRDVFTNGELRLFNRACLASAVGFFQQFCGINAIAFYESTIFEQYLHLTGQDARILSASVFTFQTLCSPIGVLTVDRFGRRKLMLVSAAGMSCCMGIIAGSSSDSSSTAAVAVASAFIFLFSLFFPVGFLGLSFLYASEISPLSVRVPITSISTGVVWLSNFVIAEMTPASFAGIGWRYYIVFATINLFLILPSVFLFFPETNGRTLEEMDTIFRESKHVLDPVKVSRRMPRVTREGDVDYDDDEKVGKGNNGAVYEEDRKVS
ncbi:MAG: hypothetical protein M1828_005706 [Chrysothrix sp. TS-e1954]|nr:MAG: hypothetical protein M1828_005706 [Chrysothrix sp. TS-e1954]